jgi:hypothetical protein
MSTTCECGVPIEPPSHSAQCQECGAVGCASCAIHLEGETYCRWCAWVLTRRRVA